MSGDRYPTLMVTTEACMTDQWNFPHDRLQPWARDGVCSICGQEVEMERVGPDSPYTYSHIAAAPHQRTVTWCVIREDELLALLDYRECN